jgi:CBS domain-containing protein
MKARDLMTRTVVTATPDTPVAAIARLLTEHGISAVPVVDAAGMPVGMVSEGDLIARSDTDREARRDWWLTLFAEGEAKKVGDVVGAAGDRSAHQIMSSPVVTIGEDTDTGDIARLLSTYHIKRLPVLKDGRLTGIVSRGDLVRALASPPPAGRPEEHRHSNLLAEMLEGLERHFQTSRHPSSAPAPAAPAESAAPTGPTVGDFRDLVADHDARQARQRTDAQRSAADLRSDKIKGLIDRHIGNEAWQTLLHRAREAAERGQKDFMLLRFPSELCSDGGRAINVPLPEWPDTLRGEAAELYLRWERDLKPSGFRLSARILDFPGGKPGDAGLFLSWEE